MPGGKGGKSGKGPERARFAALLHQHLEDGTRPRMPAGLAGSPWVVGVFAQAVGGSDRAVRYWRSGETLPSHDNLQFILDALFSDDPLLDAAREELQQAWTAADAAMGAARPANSAPVATPLPRFPALPRRILGREAEASRLRNALLADGERAVLVLGPGGIGKTSLTQHVANEPDVVARFQARAFAALETTPSAIDMAAQIATSLGVSPALPFEAVIARLAEAPTLLVLDNLETPWLADREGTEALLVRLAIETGAVLVGSMRGERAPAAPDWVEHHVEPLAPEAATALFRRHATRVGAEDPYLSRLIHALGGMPLAIWLVAQRAAGLRSLEGLWAEWERQGVALARDPEMVEGPRTSVPRSILFSLEAKPVKAAGKRLFALLGQLPAGLARKDCDALLGTAGFDAAGQLLGVGLAFSDAQGRIDLLPPVRDFARRETPPTGMDVTAWAAHFLAITAREDDRAWRQAGARVIARLAPDLPNIEAAAAACGALGLAVEGSAAAWSLHNLLIRTGRREHPLEAIGAACKAARDTTGEANCLRFRADIANLRSDYGEARRGYEEARLLFRAAEKRVGEAHCLAGLAHIARARSKHDEARHNYSAALAIFQAEVERIGEANCLFGLAHIANARSEHKEARRGYEAALTIFRTAEGRTGEADCVRGLAEIEHELSNFETARDGYRQALQMYEAAGERIGQAHCLRCLAEIARDRSEHEDARRDYEAALAIFRAAGARIGEARCWLGMARLALANGDFVEARTGMEAALARFRELDSIWNGAHALQALGDLESAAGDVPAAQAWYRQSEAGFLSIDNAVTASKSRARREALGG